MAGISFGNSLIKQVARDLSRDLPNLKTFVTLSPIPGLAQWLSKKSKLSEEIGDAALKKLAAHYLVNEKSPKGLPLDPVARFHLSNGALIHAIHIKADISPKGMNKSRGVMVNYLYDLKKISRNLQQLADSGVITTSTEVRSLARQAAKSLAG